MALTDEQMKLFRLNYQATVIAHYPGIAEVPIGRPDTIDTLMETWRDKEYPKPTAEQLEKTFLETVLPAQEAEQAGQQTRKEAVDDILGRLTNSPLADKTPTEVFTIMQGQIDGWGSLAAAKADLRVWLPLIVAAIFWLVRRK